MEKKVTHYPADHLLRQVIDAIDAGDLELAKKNGIIKLREGLPKFMRGFRDGLTKNFVDFMRVSREGLV